MGASSAPQDEWVLRGGCRCNHVAFTTSQLPESISYCHCEQCRKLLGAPFGTFGDFPMTAIKWTRGGVPEPDKNEKPDVEFIELSDMATRGFCVHCRSPVLMRYHDEPQVEHLMLGLVDEVHADARDGLHKLRRSHLFWTESNCKDAWGPSDGSPTYETMSANFMRALDKWRAQGAPRRKDATML